VEVIEMSGDESDPPGRRRAWVRVWFGDHVIADYRADAELANRYAEAMSRRFTGLRITTEPLPPGRGPTRPLPGERLWDVTPR
jgi:hypothetical protein